MNLVVDAFAGPGGWDEGLRAQGWAGRLVGFEWDELACQTAMTAGHLRVRADVSQLVPIPCWGLIMSPPCQAWSRAGKRLGLLDQPAIYAHLQLVRRAGRWIDYPKDGWHDPRSPLVLEVIRWVLGSDPVWIACEQVPDVLPFWQEVARWLAGLGYHTWTGVLSAEQYGVPQTRQRAILLAHRHRPVRGPLPTHRAYDARMPDGGRWGTGMQDVFSLDGDGLDDLQPWVSMADALGWGLSDNAGHRCRPAEVVINTRGARRTAGGNDFPASGPAWALTEKTRSWVVRTGQQHAGPEGTVVPFERGVAAPSPTLDTHMTRWVVRTGKNSQMTASGDLAPYERSINAPSPTVDTESGLHWKARMGDVRSSDGTVRTEDELASALTASADIAESVRISVEDALVLQSFRSDYPVQGSKSAKFRQIGDAVPPLLARAVLAQVLD